MMLIILLISLLLLLFPLICVIFMERCWYMGWPYCHMALAWNLLWKYFFFSFCADAKKNRKSETVAKLLCTNLHVFIIWVALVIYETGEGVHVTALNSMDKKKLYVNTRIVCKRRWNVTGSNYYGHFFPPIYFKHPFEVFISFHFSPLKCVFKMAKSVHYNCIPLKLWQNG